MKFTVGERVYSLMGQYGERHEGTIVQIGYFADGTPMYHVKRDEDAFIYVAQESWIDRQDKSKKDIWDTFRQAASSMPASGLTLHDSPPVMPQVGDTWIDTQAGGDVHIFVDNKWVKIANGPPAPEPDLNEAERRYLRESLGLNEETEL